MHNLLHDYGRGEGTERICAFSDGVFAIAITLLVLNLQVPQAVNLTPGTLAHAVWALRPQFAAFALSFAVIGMLWVSHHRMFAQIRHHDMGLLWLNLVVLALVAFLPFPTGLLAEHPGEPFAVAFYAGVQVLTILAQTLLWCYAAGTRRLVAPNLDTVLVRYVTLRGVVAATVFALSVPLAWLSTEGATLSWALIPVGFLVLNRVFRRASAESTAEAFDDRPAEPLRDS